MGAHEKLETILGYSPRKKVLIILAILAVIVVCFYGIQKLGRSWATAEYNEKRVELETEIERRIKNEAQLAGENALLKKQNEALANAYEQADTQRERDNAKKFADLIAIRTEKFAEIDADADFDNQLCGLCEDARRSGFPLSKETCSRCEVTK